MSNLTQRRGAVACAAFPTLAPTGDLRQLIAARQEQAKGRVHSYFAQHSDDRLAQFGFTVEHFRALRAGELRLPRR
jgi:hypothetical protein